MKLVLQTNLNLKKNNKNSRLGINSWISSKNLRKWGKRHQYQSKPDYHKRNKCSGTFVMPDAKARLINWIQQNLTMESWITQNKHTQLGIMPLCLNSTLTKQTLNMNSKWSYSCEKWTLKHTNHNKNYNRINLQFSVPKI